MRPILTILCACAIALAAAGCSEDKAASSPPPESTTVPGPPIAPLTGLPDPDGVARDRCAVTVKVDNTPDGRPWFGLDQADVVYEEVVEGGITRLAAIFNAQAPDSVGPVRSVRLTDQSLVRPIGGVFAYSGGAQYALDSIDTAPVVQLDETRAGDAMFRDDSRNAPYNLYARVNDMYPSCGPKVPPPPLFSYREANTPAAGIPATSAEVGFLAGFDVTWTWDPSTSTWSRAIFDEPAVTASGTPIAPENVVIMFTDYIGGDAVGLGAEAKLTGEGKLIVLTGGNRIPGTWSRPDPEQPAELLDATGAEIRLTPGQTWVELPDDSYSVTVKPPVDSPS
jgi:hypothetical protein